MEKPCTTSRFRFSRRLVTRVTQPLASLAFGLGVWLAYRQFPDEYDWHYIVLSALQSPKDNPEGYRWLAIGLALSAMLLLPLVNHLFRALEPSTQRGARAVRLMLRVGIACMALVALFTHRPSSFPRLHENLAFISYFSLVAALLTTTVLFLRHPDATILAERPYRRWILRLLPLAIFIPLFAAGLTQLFLYVFPPMGLGWVDLSWRERGIPFYLSFAFWQWMVSAMLYLSAWLIAWVARAQPEREVLCKPKEVGATR